MSAKCSAFSPPKKGQGYSGETQNGGTSNTKPTNREMMTQPKSTSELSSNKTRPQKTLTAQTDRVRLRQLKYVSISLICASKKITLSCRANILKQKRIILRL